MLEVQNSAFSFLAARYFKSVYFGMRLMSSAAYQFISNNRVKRIFPSRPVVLQFPINDVCNSRCVMCNIWQRKLDKQFSPSELKQILSDPLFSKIKYVGINGGEPTLRSDLSEIGETIINSFPQLREVGILTNALNSKQVIERISGLSSVMSNAGIPFSVSVSLDGIGDEHDQNRGVPGNFASALEVIHALKARNTPVSIGCTLTSLNCYAADDVLLWCEQNNLASEFRLGIEIKRVYNEGFDKKYPLSQAQRFHLVMFFDKLANSSHVNFNHQCFYKSLVDQLSFSAPRQIGCDWQSSGVTLDARGDISYCSVQSPVLGSALGKSAWSIYKDNLHVREQIINEKCGSCCHDLTGPLPPAIAMKHGASMVVSPWLRIGKRVKNKYLPSLYNAPKYILPATNPNPSQWKHVLITGWYGTETAGDKAILGELLHFLNTYAPGCRISLTTLDRKVSVQTNTELAYAADINLVDMHKGCDPAFIESVDAVIIGGGPLEEIDQTEYIWQMFAEANKQKKARILFGCGVGPIYTDHIRNMIAAICQMATSGFLRDKESQDYAFKLGATAPLGCACDPAIAYFSRWASNLNKKKLPYADSLPRIIGLLRANTDEYVRDMAGGQLESYNNVMAKKMAQIMENVCGLNGTSVDLLPMHSIWVGGDDRIFNRFIARNFSSPQLVKAERSYLSLDELLGRISTANGAVAMRYHGHLACLALGIPFLSINYTGEKSKVASLVKRIGYQQWSETWRDIDPLRATARLQQLIEEKSSWSDFLLNKTSSLISELHQTYAQVFNIKDANHNR